MKSIKEKQNKESKEKVILELTRDQAWVIEKACELLARLHIGQFRTITEMLLPIHSSNIKDYCRKRDDANEALELAAKLMFGRTAYNTPDCQKSEEHNRAWNIYQVLRYTRSWHDNPEGDMWSVCFDEPMNMIAGEPMPTCRIEDKE